MNFHVGDGQTVRVNIQNEWALLGAMEERLARDEGFAVATLNLDHLVKLAGDAAFRAAYARQDFVTADGNPIVWLARAAKQKVELLPGSDLIWAVLRLAARLDISIALVGSTNDNLRRAAHVIAERLPEIRIRHCVAPPMGFDPESPSATALLDDLEAQGVRLVFLALGAPKQERLAALGRQRHPRLAFVSVGAGVDFIAGAQRRAPSFVRRLALEWLWRMALNPRRLAWRYVQCAAILPGHALRALEQRSTRRP